MVGAFGGGGISRARAVHLGSTTTVLGITWQVGRTGKLTPVAELEAVEVAGSTVRRATLHNADELGRLGLRVGHRVFIEKGGEVIPKVVALVPGLAPEPLQVSHSSMTGMRICFSAPRAASSSVISML